MTDEELRQKLETMANDLMTAQRVSRKEKKGKLYAPRSTTASSLGYKCVRRLVYARTKPEFAEPIGEELASIFDEGEKHETDVKRELLELGYEPMEGQRMFRDEALEIGGMMDCALGLTSAHRAQRIPTEIKSCTGRPPQTAEEMKHHDGIYGRYFAQMQVYLVLSSEPWGLFIFKDKIVGLWTVVPVALDYDYAESLLKKAESVRDHMRAGTLPDRTVDRSQCIGCPFRLMVCHPDDADVDPMQLAKDEQLLADIIEHQDLDAGRKRFKSLDDNLKARFKITKGDQWVVGDEDQMFMVKKKKHGKGERIVIERLGSK